MSIETSWSGRVLHVALNRPEKRNALNAQLCRELIESLEADAGAIVLSGNGPSFCAGMDLHETAHAELHEQLFTAIRRLRRPLVAAVHGAALGGGTGLVANAHIVIAAPDAKFGLPEIRIGLWPVLVFRAIALAIGERRATELSITGRTFSAQEALAWGLVSEIAESPLQRALELASSIAQSATGVIAAGLDYVNQIRGMNWDDAGSLGRDVRQRMLAGDEFGQRSRAFLERRS